jgi:hypothetical protein
MTVRVDLLKKSEFRHQGGASSVLIVRSLTILGVAACVLFSAGTVLRFRAARRELISCRETWKQCEPVYNQLQAMKQDMATQRKLETELKGWEQSRVLWEGPLVELQEIVPPVMQLRRLAIEGRLETILLPAPPPPPGDELGESDQAAPEPPKQLARRFHVFLDGKVVGEMAEDVVVQFVRVLSREKAFDGLLENVKLQSLQRESGQSAVGPAGRVFSIEARSRKIDIQ